MATVLVTRPAPDNERTAQALRARGYDVLLAPVLTAEPLPFECGDPDVISGIVVTSANALRVVADHSMFSRLRSKPLFAVGESTAGEARALQFGDVRVAGGNASALVALIASQRSEKIKSLLYLAGEDVSRDLASELAAEGIVVTATKVYRMKPATDLPEAALQAVRQGGTQAVLHYSRRSAEIFIGLMRARRLEIAALAVPQCCLSQSVADVLIAAGAGLVVAAKTPNEQSLFEALDHALARVHQS